LSKAALVNYHKILRVFKLALRGFTPEPAPALLFLTMQ